jgi:DNA-binding response OmpR family regulator
MTTILFVEDEIELAGIVRRELEASGYQVRLATDGRQALRQFEQHAPDLVILDWMLPELDGLEVLRQIRKSAATPVLMLTARGDPTDRVVGLEVGADDYLVKPFNLAELVARVRALLRRVERIREQLAADQAPAQRPLKYGGLALDPQAHTFALGGQPLELTPIEFELLRLLMANPGRTFNRIYLAETVWNAPYLEGDRAVDNAVMRLRKKLEQMGDCLETVRGVGYRLRALAGARPGEAP